MARIWYTKESWVPERENETGFVSRSPNKTLPHMMAKAARGFQMVTLS